MDQLVNAQNLMHEANQARMSKIEEKQDRAYELLVTVATKINCLPELEKRVTALEADSNQKKGALMVVGIVAGAVSSGLVEMLRLLFHK